jgi:RNA polymerase sigma factor (sigma-70 family)
MAQQEYCSIAVVDDDPAVLKSVARLLKLNGYATRTYSSAEILLAELQTVRPNCIVADLSMPGKSGLELQREIAETGAAYPIIFITGRGDIRSSVEAMRGGAVDFLPKPFERAELLDAVRRALAKDREARESDRALETITERLSSLTPREREVFERVVEGLMNKQVAAMLGITEKTVKVHRARVMSKMAVRSVAELARIAERLGIRAPD